MSAVSDRLIGVSEVSGRMLYGGALVVAELAARSGRVKEGHALDVAALYFRLDRWERESVREDHTVFLDRCRRDPEGARAAAGRAFATLFPAPDARKAVADWRTRADCGLE